MTLPPFDLHRASSVEEARELLVRYGDDAAVICGGTELLLLLKLGFAAYGHLVDIKGIEELGGVRAERGTLVIGATATHREIERSPLVLERLPALAAMEREVANIRVRNVGTLGGNLCFSDPHSDPATFLLALDAEVEYDGARELLAEFLVGPYETALAHGQLLHSVRIPLPREGTRIAHRKLSFHERPAATVAWRSPPPARSPRRRQARSRTRTAASSTRSSSSACWSSAACAKRCRRQRRLIRAAADVSRSQSARSCSRPGSFERRVHAEL